MNSFVAYLVTEESMKRGVAIRHPDGRTFPTEDGPVDSVGWATGNIVAVLEYRPGQKIREEIPFGATDA